MENKCPSCGAEKELTICSTRGRKDGRWIIGLFCERCNDEFDLELMEVSGELKKV